MWGRGKNAYYRFLVRARWYHDDDDDDDRSELVAVFNGAVAAVDATS